MKKSIYITPIILMTSLIISSQNLVPFAEKKVTITEQVNFEGWPNCIKLSNGRIELIVTTDVGPRIISFGYVGGQNVFYVAPTDKGKTGGKDWHLYGGHRLWHAPEAIPRSYAPDNSSVKHTWDGKTLKLVQDIEPTTSLIKELEITLSAENNEVEVLHRLINKSSWSLELSAWSISACASGGRAIVPQEPYTPPEDNLLPSRPLVLWPYTKMTDHRYIWGDRFIQAKQDKNIISETKIGVLNKQEWSAFYLNKLLFIKTFEYDPDALYPDFGSNNEIYINGDFLEVETLGPLTKIAPEEALEHTEYWLLERVKDLSEDEDEIEQIIKPLLTSYLREK